MVWVGTLKWFAFKSLISVSKLEIKVDAIKVNLQQIIYIDKWEKIAQMQYSCCSSVVINKEVMSIPV